MNIVREIVGNTAIGIAVTHNSEDLNMLFKPECAAAIWQRDIPIGFQEWIDELDPADLPTMRLNLRPQNVRTRLSEACDAAGMTKSPHRQCLINDIATLTHLFGDLMGASYVRLRLDRVTTNACRKFHIDAITARLVCTYRGTGTQYGTSANSAEPQRVSTVPTGHPIVLRGTLWPEYPRAGLLHRSPPIEGSGETRLVLVLDPISDPEGVL